MTKAEIDLTMKILRKAKKAYFQRHFGQTLMISVNLMASGEVVIQFFVVPALVRL